MKKPNIYHEHVPELISLWKRSAEQLWGTEGQLAWYDQTMRRVLMYGTLLRRYKVQPEGVLYVGAHYGSLLWVWLLLGFRNVLMVEPQKEVLQGLQQVAKTASALSLVYDQFLGSEEATQIQIATCAIGEQDGEADLYVMSYNALTSMQKPNESLLQQARMDKDVSLLECVKVPVRTIDSLLQDLAEGGSTANYNTLYMNIQGAELKALKGATKSLEKLEFIYLENNFKSRYDGTPTTEEIDAFLAEFGFEAKWGMIQPSIGNGYTAYVKTRGP